MWDPILVALLKMRPHYSNSSLDNATPSSLPRSLEVDVGGLSEFVTY